MSEATDGGHLHIEHYPDHPYIGEGSLPLVVNSPTAACRADTSGWGHFKPSAGPERSPGEASPSCSTGAAESRHSQAGRLGARGRPRQDLPLFRSTDHPAAVLSVEVERRPRGAGGWRRLPLLLSPLLSASPGSSRDRPLG
jgi:hypothetical protein